MLPTDKNQSGSLNVAHLKNSALNAVETCCGVLSRPIELVLRPFHGTRYFAVPVVAMSSLMMLLLPAIGALMTAAISLIPFSHPARSIGMFDMASFSELYFMLSVAHGVRHYRLMTHLEREEHSCYEGKPLPLLQILPWSKSFWVTRIVLEPAFVLVVAMVLEDLLIIQSGLALFLRLSALALMMRNFVSWYRSWEYLRDLMDARNAGPILAKLVDNSASDDDLASINLASFPKDISPEIRTQAATSIARAYSPNH